MPKNLAVKLKPIAEKMVKLGHPWVFSKSITKISKNPNTGDLAVLFDHKTDKIFGFGLYDADAPVRIKVIHSGGAIQINSNFFKEKIQRAFRLRLPVFEEDTNAYRLIFGENDGFPGVIFDVYNGVGVLKLYSAVWFPYLKDIIPHFMEIAGLSAVILRLSRKLQREEHHFKEGQILAGDLETPEIIFKEYGVRFKANLLLGHKTGFFLDHRENRHKIGLLSKGKTVLDVFSYAGGFSVHALAGGAKAVTSLDFSHQALALSEENVALNPPVGNHKTISGDAFEILKELIAAQKKYEVVIIDPPSFAKQKKEREGALKKYAELAELGAKLTENGGLLFLASCSSRIETEEFRAAHEEVFLALGVAYRLEDFTEHAIDHPVTFHEGSYLKSAYYRIFK